MRSTKKVSKKTLRDSTKTSKVIRDSFSMIEKDYDLISDLKGRCLKLGMIVNKSQILRAGLNALNTMSDASLAKVVKGLDEVKTGRQRRTQ
jgi:acetylornithine/succinyldiaminopimelate/putrescine aminotransferase